MDTKDVLCMHNGITLMPSNHLILCYPLLLLPSIFPRSGSFQMSQFFASGGQNIEFQFQHQSFKVYMLVYDTCFSLYDLLHWVLQAVCSSTSLELTQMHSFLLLSDIPLYIYIYLCVYVYIYTHTHRHTTTSLSIDQSVDI